jgi:hypothetical protein
VHDVACSLRPGDRSFRAPAPGLTPPDNARGCPWPDLVEDWQRLYPFFQTVAAGGTELAESPVIYGPFRLDWISAMATALNVPNNQITIGVDYSDIATGVNFDISGQVSAGPTGDNGANPTNLMVSTVPTIIPVGLVLRHGATRLVYAYRNATGGSVSVFGHMHITHLRPATDGYQERVY